MTDTLEAITMSVEEVMKIIPHRYPFLMIDRVEEIIPGQTGKGFKNISMNEPQFLGHFPGLPIMPGVLQVEAAAQLSCLTMLSMPEYSEGYLGMFTGIESVKFRQKVVPGDRMDIEVSVAKFRFPFGKFNFKVTVAGEVASEGLIGFVMAKKDDLTE